MNKKRFFLYRSLQAQLVLAVGLCLLVVGGAIVGYAAITFYNSTVADANARAVDQAQIQANAIKAQVDTAMDSARTTGVELATLKAKDQPISLTREQVNRMLLNVLQTTPEFFATYTLWEPNAFDGKDADFANTDGHDATGRFIPYWSRGGTDASINLTPLVDYEKPGAGDYYLIPKQTMKESVIEPYLYTYGTNTVLMTSLIEPIVVDGKFYGISGVDLTLDFLQKLADGVDIYNKTGKLELISNTGIIAASTGQPELVNKNISDEMKDSRQIASLVQTGKDYQAVEDGYLTVYTPVVFGHTTTPWSVRIKIPYETIIADAKQSTLTMVALGVALMGFGLLGIWFLVGSIAIKQLKIMSGALENLSRGDLNRGIPQSVKETIVQRDDEIGKAGKGLASTEAYLITMAEMAQKIADGDLTVTVTPRSEKDELGQAFAKMVAGLQRSMGEVSQSAAALSSASEQLASVSGQAGQATAQIAATIQQIARGTTQQSEAITQTSQSVEQVGQAIERVTRGAKDQAASIGRAAAITGQINASVSQVSGNAQVVSRNSAEAAGVARTGAKTVAETVQGMQTIKERVSVSADKVKEMGQRSGQIGAIVETIEDIASQTNLLALNAAIEAARAGEHGKGFAVVADEVRKLAERASSATKEIGGLIKSIQSTVEEAISAMNQSAGEVERGVELANKAGSSLEDILKAVEAVNQQAGQATHATEVMKTAAGELVQAMDSVSAVVDEYTLATKEMSAGSSEVSQAIENIASVSEENSAAVEEVSASAEEMTAQVEEVAGSAQSLAEMAEAFKQVAGRFKLSVEDYAAERGAPASPDPGRPAGKTTAALPIGGNGHKARTLAL